MTSMPRGFEKLQPADFWRHFCELSRIPRCSRNEAKIRSYIIDQAARFNLDFRVDAAGNLVVVKPASGGHASRPTAVLQCHLDMVCEKEPDLDFDFDTDPIQLIREGDWLRADGTTLGADNGVGIALCLACSNRICATARGIAVHRGWEDRGPDRRPRDYGDD
jgi:dipeptidase D